MEYIASQNFTSPSMNFQEEIAMNNNAVALLQEGNTKEAIVVFKYALRRMREHFATASLIESEHQACNPVLGDIAALDLSFSSIDTGCIEDDDDDKCSSEKPLFRAIPVLGFLQPSHETCTAIYDHALQISHEENDRDILTSVILFNLGLIYHSKGIYDCRSRCLSRALSFYQKAFQVLGSEKEAQLGLLLLAIFNNTAHIFSYLFQLDEMHQCLQCMRDILADLEDIDSDTNLEFFYLNAIVYGARDLFSLAPAA